MYNNINSLNEILIEIGNTYNFIPTKLKYNGFCCTKIIFNKDNCNLHLVIDPNNSRHEMSWKDVKEMCEKTNVVFKNQSFASMITQLRNRFENATRHIFTKTEREQIYNDCNKKCNHCNKDLKKTEMQIDHIVPLVVGGSNDIDNLQILCRPCHFSKTKSELDSDQYVKQSPTLSSFNTKVNDIINSSLATTHSFVETINQKIPKKYKSDVYTFDINKCRKNCLYFSKFDFPVFTVMDEVVPFTGDVSKPGLYYLESAQAFPIRGNGFYSQAMINYLLDQEIITLDQIKYVIYASCSIPHDFF